MPKPLTQIGRLAMREEGDCWNGYYAMPDTMKDAQLLGSIHMAIIADRPDRREAFMAILRDAVADIIEKACGTRPTWPNKPKTAPEHERGGSA